MREQHGILDLGAICGLCECESVRVCECAWVRMCVSGVCVCTQLSLRVCVLVRTRCMHYACSYKSSTRKMCTWTLIHGSLFLD